MPTITAPPRFPESSMTPTAVLPTCGPSVTSSEATAMAMGSAASRKNPITKATGSSAPSEPRCPSSHSVGAATTPARTRKGFLRRIRSLAAPSTTEPTIPAMVIIPATSPAPVSPMPRGFRISSSHVVMPR